MTAITLKGWFIKNDMKFGMGLLHMTPEEQGAAIAERYGFDLDEIHKDYDQHGKEEGDARLLARLNAWSGE